ncbi:MAG: hypothetical protein CW346_06070 [Bacillaceae bacterium]|nr:hypothetical protein [Bacillaceae bacterium]
MKKSMFLAQFFNFNCKSREKEEMKKRRGQARHRRRRRTGTESNRGTNKKIPGSWLVPGQRRPGFSAAFGSRTDFG